MLTFLLKKMLNNKWMIFCLLIGNILLVATVSAVPMFSQGSLQRLMQKQLESYRVERNAHPGMIELEHNFYYADQQQAFELFNNTRDYVLPEIIRSYDVPVLLQIENINLKKFDFVLDDKREMTPKRRPMVVSSYSGIESHITITQGVMCSDKVTDGIIECIVNQRTLDRQSLYLGDIITSTKFTANGTPIKMKVVGIYENSEERDFYWTQAPSEFINKLVVSDKVMYDYLLFFYDKDFGAQVIWQYMLDSSKLDATKSDLYIKNYEDAIEGFSDRSTLFYFRTAFTDLLRGYQALASKLNVTLWVLQVPVFVLLAFFIFMVSQEILRIEQNEISVIKSRGAGRNQIISIYFMQSLIVLLAAAIIGIPLGLLFCRLLGSTSGFLNLVSRRALRVSINSGAFQYSAIAVAVSLLTMTLPVLKFSKVTIVDYKRSRSSNPKKPIWRLLFLDVIILGLSIYSLYSFYNQRNVMSAAIVDVNAIDPVLLLSSSLFIIGMGLVSLRIFPYLVRLIYLIGKRFWPPSLFASFLKVIRSAGEERFIMIFIIFTLAVGIFSAKTARTINLNTEDKISYQIGADIVFKEVWPDNLTKSAMSAEGGEETEVSVPVYIEPDIERYASMPEVISVAKVFRDERAQATVSSGTVNNVKLMAINTKTFGETAWTRDDITPIHINNYLNALAKEPTAVLLSRNFESKYNFKIGDGFRYRTSTGSAVAIIYGFVDNWPGFSNVARQVGTDGKISYTENFLIVANLNYVQSVMGLTPYEVWLKINVSSGQFLADYFADNQTKLLKFANTNADIIASKSDPMLQATNGILTLGFFITIIVTLSGFLIYWILSIKSRVLQFGIFRAMGMSFKNVAALLFNEQIFISGIAIIIGIIVGEVSSRLFVPLIQISYVASEKLIPFKIVIQAEDYQRLFSVFGSMIFVCMIILIAIISKIKISQALKLGED